MFHLVLLLHVSRNCISIMFKQYACHLDSGGSNCFCFKAFTIVLCLITAIFKIIQFQIFQIQLAVK